jgi:hypothetical protein
VGGAYLGGRWTLCRLSTKIQKKKTVTENVQIFTDKDCDPYVTDPSTLQGGRPMTHKTKFSVTEEKNMATSLNRVLKVKSDRLTD